MVKSLAPSMQLLAQALMFLSACVGVHGPAHTGRPCRQLPPTCCTAARAPRVRAEHTPVESATVMEDSPPCLPCPAATHNLRGTERDKHQGPQVERRASCAVCCHASKLAAAWTHKTLGLCHVPPQTPHRCLVGWSKGTRESQSRCWGTCGGCHSGRR